MAETTVIIAFVAGLISFVSPCVLPLMPGFLAYLSGTTLKDADNKRLKIFLNSLAFVLGFSVVFAVLGVILATFLANSSLLVQTWLSRIGGIIIIIFGLHVLGLIKIPFLEREVKLSPRKKFNISYLTSFFFGAAFAVGWSPCVGPILGSVFTLAAANPSLSFVLLLAYSLGLGIPFLLIGLFTQQAVNLIKRSAIVFKYFNLVVGILLLLIGVLVFTNKLNVLSNFGILIQFLK